jgi:hypothetical protein
MLQHLNWPNFENRQNAWLVVYKIANDKEKVAITYTDRFKPPLRQSWHMHSLFFVSLLVSTWQRQEWVFINKISDWKTENGCYSP